MFSLSKHHFITFQITQPGLKINSTDDFVFHCKRNGLRTVSLGEKKWPQKNRRIRIFLNTIWFSRTAYIHIRQMCVWIGIFIYIIHSYIIYLFISSYIIWIPTTGTVISQQTECRIWIQKNVFFFSPEKALSTAHIKFVAFDIFFPWREVFLMCDCRVSLHGETIFVC